MSLNNSITKGILSARRTINGLVYYQTDASINHGNSGGPVFDASGELVALTVAGVFTQGGASLNVNYLIPIEDALTKLNIESAEINIFNEAVSDETLDKLDAVYESVKDLFE
jgi:S1-C subfamily serine protease